MTTPMRQQYLRLKAAHPDSILLFRLGDFYETFDDDAKIVARVCDVVLTSRPVGGDQRVPLAGVPYHAVDGYVAKLVDAGYRVAIAEQITEPGKGLVEREITRVISRGTVTEPGMLNARRNNYLVAASQNARGTAAGIAACDISTGEFVVTELAAPHADALEARVGEELSRLQPSELIPVDWEPAQSSLHGLVMALAPLISHVEPWQTAPETAAESLRRHFGVASLDAFGLRDKPEATRAAAALLAYVRGMAPAALGQMRHLRLYSVDAFMVLDESTRRNLELTETMRGGGEAGSLLEVLDATLTPMGGRLLRRRLSQPLLDVETINRRLDGVALFVEQTERRLLLRELLKGMGDLERWTLRCAAGQALPRDLVGLRDLLGRIPALLGILEGAETLARAMPAGAPESAALLAERLHAALADSPPATLATPGIFRDDFSPELADLVQRSRHAKDWIANLERTERERLDIKSLKVGYNKVFGYYIEVTAAHTGKAPPEYIRKQTIANGERYITPDLKEYEALVLNADERRLELEQALFAQLCAEVASHTPQLMGLAAFLAALDVAAALAEVALERRYVRPVVDEGPAILITGGRHPVVELAQRDVPFVPNDTRLLPEAAIQIITGPNMSGKSTWLRQVALITLLAQIGSFVPAESAQIGVVDRIFTRLGASDEIHRGQSTFMVEMVETAHILHHATNRSLLVLDEIGRGTSTYDGLAIAWAVIEYIHNHPGLRARTLFATHYHELTELAQRLPHVVNYNVAVDEGGKASSDGGAPDVVFLHRIVPGKADRSYGVHVARMAGLPPAAVHRAEEILADLERSGAAGPRRLFEPETRAGRAARPAPGVQAALFAETHPAIEALRSLDVNALTPLEALNRLYELVKLAK